MTSPFNPIDHPGWKAGWKVVTEDHNGHLWSCIHDPCHPLASSQYGMGLRAERPARGGPLCVFEDAKSARQFMLSNFKDRNVDFHGVAKVLHPCWYLPSKEGAVWRPPLLEPAGTLRALVTLPTGTVLAEAVVLCGQPFFHITSARYRLPPTVTTTPLFITATVTTGSI